jgi:hypothetical protein
MKKQLLTFLILFIALPIVWADNLYFNITQEHSVAQIQTELQMRLDNTSFGDTIFVTGSKTNADTTLTLNIADGQIVVWQATYQSDNLFGAENLITLFGEYRCTFEVASSTLITKNANAISIESENVAVIVSGTGKVQTSGNGAHAITTNGFVEIKDNARHSSTTGETIESKGNGAIVLVAGGTITATSENAIITWGENSEIYISGGYVYNDAVGVYNAVYALDREYGYHTLVHVCGDAIVEARGMGAAVASYGSVKVSGNAQVRNTMSGGNYDTHAIMAYRSVEVCEDAIVSSLNRYTNRYTILCWGEVIVRGSAIVKANENAIAIFIHREGRGGRVTVKEKGQVIAANNYAISYNI